MRSEIDNPIFTNAELVFHDGFFHVYVYLTGEAWNDEEITFGDTRRQGWVDPSWSMTEFHENRNDVCPLVTFDCLEFTDGVNECVNEDGLTLAEAIIKAVESEIGPVEGDGPLYAQDARQDLVTGDVYTYAAHVEAVDHAMRWPKIRTTRVVL